ncbi:MAG: ribosome biogenesis GTPase YlqF [Eubacteriaceae bacterium]|nr:ribosome biogenesis GTPase YlqF [Eubacteriaceae bacterium]
MEIQWYPGHMAKAERQIREQASKADVIIVLGDARAVGVSLNDDFIKSLGKRKYIVAYNKTTLADDGITESWEKYYNNKDPRVFFTDCSARRGIAQIKSYLKEIRKTFKFDRELRMIVAGIPNVGKSMFINTLLGKLSAKTGNTPGVTRGSNWIKGSEDYYLLDTPGVLPPKFATAEEGALLASIGCVKEEILDKQKLAYYIIDLLKKHYPDLLAARYKVDPSDRASAELFEEICINRRFILSGERIDYARGANCIIDEFKNGKIGKMSFISPGDMK